MSNVPLIQVLPLPGGVLLNGNKATITGIDNQSIKDYKPNGNYVVTASSTANNNTMPYNVFNSSEQYFWQCDYNNNPSYNSITTGYPQYTKDPFNSGQPSTYQGGGDTKNKWVTQIGSGSNVANLSGEWIQVQLPYSVYLYKYSIMTPSYSSNISTFPTKFTLVGSNDGNTWSYLDQQNVTADKMPSAKQPMKTVNINSVDKYSYFRLIISEMCQGMNIVKINQLNLFGLTSIIVNPNVGSENFTLLSGNNLMETRETNFVSYSGNISSLESSPFYGIPRAQSKKDRYESFDNYNTTNQLNSQFNYNQLQNNLVTQINNYTNQIIPQDQTAVTNAIDSETLAAANATLSKDKAALLDLSNQLQTINSQAISNVNNFQISPMIQISSNYSTLLNKIHSTYGDLSNNIAQITNSSNTGLRDVMLANDKYDFSGNLLNYNNYRPTLNDARIEDTNTLILQQNSIYILGTLASATLLIFAIMLARE